CCSLWPKSRPLKIGRIFSKLFSFSFSSFNAKKYKSKVDRNKRRVNTAMGRYFAVFLRKSGGVYHDWGRIKKYRGNPLVQNSSIWSLPEVFFQRLAKADKFFFHLSLSN